MEYVLLVEDDVALRGAVQDFNADIGAFGRVIQVHESDRDRDTARYTVDEDTGRRLTMPFITTEEERPD